MAKEVFAVDTETGEIVAAMGGTGGLHHPYGAKWLALNQAVMFDLISSLTPIQTQILMLMICAATNGNRIQIDQKAAAKTIGITREHLSTSIGALVKLGIIEKKERTSRYVVHALNPCIAWKGNKGVLRAKLRRGHVVGFEVTEPGDDDGGMDYGMIDDGEYTEADGVSIATLECLTDVDAI